MYQPGNYVCEIIGSTSGRSKEKQTPYFRLIIKPIHVLGNPDATVDDGPTQPIDFWITEKTVERNIQTLQRIGWDGGTFDDLLRFDFSGTRIDCIMSHNAGGYPEWRIMGGFTTDPIDRKDLDKINRLFARHAPKPARPSKEMKATKVYQEAEAAMGPNEVEGDEIPF